MNNLLGKDATAFVGHLKSKVQDAGAAIQDAQRRVTQQVLEAKRRSRKETEMRLASTIRLADDAVTTAKSLHTLQARRPALRA